MTGFSLTSIPIVMIITGVVLVLNIVSGAMRGFVRKISGLVSFILAGILVTALLPTITAWLHTTPVYSYIKEQCEAIGANLVENTISSALNGNGALTAGTGVDPGTASSVIDAVTADDGSGTLDREKIKSQLQAMGYDPSIIDSMSDADLQNYAQQMVGSYAGMIQPAGIMSIPVAGMPEWMSIFEAELPVLMEIDPILLAESTGSVGAADTSSGNGGDLLSQLTGGMDRIEQTKFIESLPLPQSIKDQMETFNNENGYQKLGATDFGSYIINYFASLVMNILAYAVTLLISWLIIRIILGTLSVFTRLPIVGVADHMLGLLLGLVQGVLIVWALFLVLSMFATTPAGAAMMEEINRTPFLSTLYNVNPFLKSAAGAIQGIM